MRHLAAYLLLQIGGNASPSAADIKKVLGAVGIEADEDRLEKLISELDGKDVSALIAEGSSKLASVRVSRCLPAPLRGDLRLVNRRSRRVVLSPLLLPLPPVARLRLLRR